ncbi:tail fiber domain-containing protein [Castellaniella denitrificans]|uniref:Tail fiber domain-containing protein n=1 Tax=Castellaniella denitrificans TaxID=56119 RepID=A0ABT4M6R3_9BURK|nr:tail fiber domain-containing protein [Castellaniella denitrificans]MCZ4330779.1 tail fiber domain-containing protein [Castellaniella denitrificans]
MRTLDILGVPALPYRAFRPDFRGLIKPAGGGKGDAPDAPDYAGAAQATAAGNLAAAKYATQANRPNQYTPWGTSTWTNDRAFNQAGYDAALASYNQALANQAAKAGNSAGGGLLGNWPEETPVNYVGGDGGSGFNGSAPVAPNASDFWSGGDNWTQTIKLSPEMQALLDQQNKLQMGLFDAQNSAAGRVNETMGQGFDMSNLPSAGRVYDPNLATNNAADLIMQRMNPDLDRQQEALRAQLAQQGITQGSQAYNNAMGQFGQQRNDALTQAQLQGIGLGMQQQGMQFNQSQQGRQQALQEQAWARSLPLNELNALRTGNQVSMPQFPGFAQQATTGGADMLGAANAGYQAQLGAYNADQAASGNMLGGLFGIGSGLLQGAGAAGGFGALFSDRRLKRDIKRVGTGAHGLSIYSYRYVWGGPVQMGYMADEVEKVAPHAVSEIGGFKTVNYGAI